MESHLNIMVGGEAGQGVQSVGMILAKTMAHGGLQVFADQDYENRVRGGHNFFRVRVSDGEVLALSEKLDILVALNKETIDLHHNGLKDSGVIIFDQQQTKTEAHGKRYFNVPLIRMAEDIVKNKLMTNTVAVGAAIGLCGYDFDLLAAVLRKEFERHGEKVVEVITMDNGPEFAGRALDEWAYRKGVKLNFIRPGKPIENAFAESFNGRFRDECLNTNWFMDWKMPMILSKIGVETTKR